MKPVIIFMVVDLPEPFGPQVTGDFHRRASKN